MELPAKALFALIDIKKNLLSRELPQTAGTPLNEVGVTARRDERTFKHPHAKTSVCTTAKFWSSFR